jgi:hypothetical protein
MGFSLVGATTDERLEQAATELHRQSGTGI